MNTDEYTGELATKHSSLLKHTLQPETRVIAIVWLLAILAAFVLAAGQGVPSPLRTLAHQLFDNTQSNWYWVGALLPANLVAIASARDSRERWRIAMAAAVVTLCCIALSMPFYSLKTAIYVGAKCCGSFGVLALLSQVKRNDGVERLFVVMMFATYLAVKVSYLPLTYLVRADTYDLFALAFDKSLGFDFAAHLFSLHQNVRVVSAILNAVYVFILVLPLTLYAAQIYRRDPQTAPMLRVFVIASTLGFFCYIVFPVSGPLYFLAPGQIDPKLLAGTPRVVEFHASWRKACLRFILLSHC